MAGETQAQQGDAGTTTAAGGEAQGGDQQTFSAEEVQKLRDLNQRLKGQLTDVEKKYKTFSDIYKDIDPDEAKALKEQKAQLERELASKDPAKMEELFERKHQKVREEYEGKLTSKDTELQKAMKELKTLKVTDRVMTDIGSLFNPDAQKFIKREVEDRCDLDEDGSIVVKDENGEVMYKGARPLTPKEFGEQLALQYPSLAKSTVTPGGKDATPGEKRPSRFKVPQNWDEWMAMPNRDAVYAQLSYEDKRRLAATKRFGT